MKHILSKIDLPDFNIREYTEDYTMMLCALESIEVREKWITNSFFMTVMGKPVIVLSKRKRGLKRLFALLHELGHYYLHAGKGLNEVYYFNRTNTKEEREADAFALIAMVPLASMQDFAFLEHHPSKFARKIWKERKRLYFLYGV